MTSMVVPESAAPDCTSLTAAAGAVFGFAGTFCIGLDSTPPERLRRYGAAAIAAPAAMAPLSASRLVRLIDIGCLFSILVYIAMPKSRPNLTLAWQSHPQL